AVQLKPDTLLGIMPPRKGAVLAEKVAANAVMAGALPEHMPVILAATKACLRPQFGIGGVAATTGGAAPVIVGLIRGRITRDRAATDARFIEALSRLLPGAERSDVRLLIEPINRYETDYLNTIGETLEIIDRVGSARIRVLADTFHMNIEERSIEDALRACGRRLGHVHVADSNREAPGFGHLDFAGILSVLDEVGYSGFLSAEIVPIPDPGSAARQTVQHLKSLLTAVNAEEGM
ncbi:MAG: sugar phosphate isomerase/epimerase, partial [Armatimonadetes bacterium]|nr:sugar phosphate isomerase/epimerase [Armatimonadota bacterium]